MIRVLKYNAISEIPNYTPSISAAKQKEKLFYKATTTHFSSLYDFYEEIVPLIFNHKKHISLKKRSNMITLKPYNIINKGDIVMKTMPLTFENLQMLFGIKGIKNILISEGISYGARKVKNKFGLDMTFTNFRQVKAVTEWIMERDSKFKDHISNPYSLNEKVTDEFPDLSGKFILKLDKATYLYIKSDILEQNNDNKKIYLYFFGKKMYKYFSNMKKYIADKAASSNMLYNITAQKSNDSSGGGYWTCIGSELVPRYMDTLYFDNNVRKQITDHLDQWLSNEDIYKDRGLIFKTGILLHGTKGTGKTSLATAIATYLKCGLINIDCTSFEYLNVADVTESINADDQRYVILLDEVDTLFADREGDADGIKQERTSKLLSFLDGPASPNNVVFVLTTNFYDKLDKAAIREGRVDLSVELKDISIQSAKQMCKDFNLTDKQTEDVLSDLEYPVNPAKLQTRILYSIKNN